MIRGLITLLVLALSIGLAHAAPEEPLQVVKSTADQVLSKLEDQQAELQQSPGKVYELVNEYVLPRFDFVYMSRLVLGRYWPRASESQQRAFTKEFRELLVRTYATALLNYSGEEIVYLPMRMTDGDRRVKVNTRVQPGGAPPIPIDYSLYLNRNRQWLVYDVAIDNISLVSQYRNSYANQIKRFKMDGLIENMQKLNQRNR